MYKVYGRTYLNPNSINKQGGNMSTNQVKRVVRADAITELMLEKRNIRSDNEELNKLSMSLLEEYTNKIRAISNQLNINLQKEAALDESIDKILMGIEIDETV